MLNAGDPCGVCSRPREVIADLQVRENMKGLMGGLPKAREKETTSSYMDLRYDQQGGTAPIRGSTGIGEYLHGVKNDHPTRFRLGCQGRFPRYLPFFSCPGCDRRLFMIGNKVMLGVFFHK